MKKGWMAALCSVTLLMASSPSAGTLQKGSVFYADEVLVFKSERILELRRNGETLTDFEVALGGQPKGHKRERGDQRTPEGKYRLDWRNPDSEFYRAIRIDYPNQGDIEQAQQRGASPGGSIMIHGLPNNPGYPESVYQGLDWTDGCIAVMNDEMDEIWVRLPEDDPIPITIHP